MRIEIDLYPILLAAAFIGSFLLTPVFVEFWWSRTCKVFGILGFGIIWVHRDDQNYWLLQDIRKRNANHHGWFIATPTWFNKYVWNVGGKK